MQKIEEKSQWRHRENELRKVRVTKVWRIDGVDGVNFDITDPTLNQHPWRDSSTLSHEKFLERYEPDSQVSNIQQRAEDLLAELIHTVESGTSPELIRLRRRIDNVLHYMDGVISPSQITLDHIKRMLTSDE